MKVHFNLFVILIVCSLSLSAQGRLSGVVTDESDEALIGAFVLIVGTTNGTVTDIDGRFSFEVESDTIRLRVDYTGFSKKEFVFIKAGNGVFPEVVIKLKEAPNICYFDIMEMDVELRYSSKENLVGGSVEIRPFSLRRGTVFGKASVMGNNRRQMRQEYAVGVLHPIYLYPLELDVSIVHARREDGESSLVASSTLEMRWRQLKWLNGALAIDTGIGRSTVKEVPGVSSKDTQLSWVFGGKFFERHTRLNLSARMQSFAGYTEQRYRAERRFGRFTPSVQYQKFGVYRELSIGLKYNFLYYKFFRRYRF